MIALSACLKLDDANRGSLPLERGRAAVEPKTTGGEVMIVIFDVVGTLFSFERMRAKMLESGLPSLFLDWWFSSLQKHAMAATMAGKYLPFREIAEASLKQVLAVAGRQEEIAPSVLEEMSTLQPWPDAKECVEALHSEGHRLVVLTNSSATIGEALLDRTGMFHLFEDVISADEVKACKPHPRPYRMAMERIGVEPQKCCMIAAHGWDVMGADAVGMKTVWVERLEKRWGFPGGPPGASAATLAGVPQAVKGL